VKDAQIMGAVVEEMHPSKSLTEGHHANAFSPAPAVPVLGLKPWNPERGRNAPMHLNLQIQKELQTLDWSPGRRRPLAAGAGAGAQPPEVAQVPPSPELLSLAEEGEPPPSAQQQRETAGAGEAGDAASLLPSPSTSPGASASYQSGGGGGLSALQQSALQRAAEAGDKGLLSAIRKVVLRANEDIASLREQLEMSQATSRELSSMLTKAEQRESELSNRLAQLEAGVDSVEMLGSNRTSNR
jgi:hypothetical protein